MLKTYLDTTESIWLNAHGAPWADGLPELIVGGSEDIEIVLVKESPGRGTAGANPESWTRDGQFADVAAMLTIDSDYIAKIPGATSADISVGDSIVSAVFSLSGTTLAGEIPGIGTLTVYNAGGESESIAYSRREIAGSTVTFFLDTKFANAYASGSRIDCRQAPLCETFLDADNSDVASGVLRFQFVFDSERLRSEYMYADTSAISTNGLELLFYATNSGSGTIQRKRAYIWDSISLRNPMGNPGVEGALPTPYVDQIALQVAQAVKDIEGAYTAFEVYPTDADIPAGGEFNGYIVDNPITASMEQRLVLRSATMPAESDVVIDWGDGTVSNFATDYNDEDGVVGGGAFEGNSSPSDIWGEIRHVYTTVGKYVLKIYGNKYFAIVNGGYNRTSNGGLYNLTSNALSDELPIASHLSNCSSMFTNSPRLIVVSVGDNVLKNVTNTSAMFASSLNLQRASGFPVFTYMLACNSMFRDNIALTYCDFRLPAIVGNTTGVEKTYRNCPKLAVSIDSLLPVSGFLRTGLSLTETFFHGRQLKAPIDGSKLWNDKNVTFINTERAFGNAPTELAALIPVSWGGIASDDIIRSGIVDSSSTAPVISLSGDSVYRFTQPLTSLTIEDAGNFADATTIVFSTGDTFALDLPGSVRFFGAAPVFSPNTTYVLSFHCGFCGVGIVAE